MNLRSRFFIVFFSIIFISLVFSGGVLYKNSERIITQNTLQNLRNIANVTESRINEMHSRYIEQLNIASRRRSLYEALDDFLKDKTESNRKQVEDVLMKFVPVVSGLEDVYVFDVKGDLIAGTARDWDGDNVAGEKFFQNALIGDYVDFRKRYPQDKYAGQLILAKAIIPKDAIAGVILILLKTDILSEITSTRLNIGATEDILLGRSNAQGDGEFIASRRFENDEEAQNIIPKERIDIPLTLALARKEAVLDKAIDYRGHVVLATTKYIKSFDIGLVVKIDRDEFIRPVRELNKVTIVFGGIIGFFTLFIAFITARSLSAPISDLSRSANRIALGDLSAKFEVLEDEEKDEVYILAQSLKMMSEKLIAVNKNLENDIRTRTQELEKRLAELELFNKVSIGREMKMIALKKEINALSKTLNLKEPYDLNFLHEDNDE